MNKVQVKWLKNVHPYIEWDVVALEITRAEYNAKEGNCEIIGEAKQNKMIESAEVETKKVSSKKK
jgi:hypothetical protein